MHKKVSYRHRRKKETKEENSVENISAKWTHLRRKQCTKLNIRKTAVEKTKILP